MATALGFALLAFAALLLFGGAELFVENVSSAARRLGITVLAVGLLLAGAEPEELLTGVIAATRDRPGLAAGDAIGANVTMLTLALGLAALARPLPFGRRVRGYALVSALAGAFAVVVLVDGFVSRLEGGALVGGYIALVAVVWWRERGAPALGELAEADASDHTSPEGDRGAGIGLLLALLGIGLMIAGGDFAIRGSVRIVDAIGLTDQVVGLTILALATTAELFALTFAAIRHEVGEVAVAGVVGSAMYNATATLGAAALARPLSVPGMLSAAVTGCVLTLVVVAFAGTGRLGRPAGACLVGGYVAYVVVLMR
jgi:cation:H+ antiporter